jgi:hypothetical protein
MYHININIFNIYFIKIIKKNENDRYFGTEGVHQHCKYATPGCCLHTAPFIFKDRLDSVQI